MEQLIPINVLAGVESSVDRRETTTQHYTFTKHIRFVDGYPEKIGGWRSLRLDNDNSLSGVIRSIFSYELGGFTRYLVGAHSRLYDVFGTVATNITPLKQTSISIANALDSYHVTLVANPISTVTGSADVVINDAAHKFRAGDNVSLSGAITANGVPATEINGTHFIREVTANSYMITVATSATSTGSGGGAGVVAASGYITINLAGHGLLDGDRVLIANSADVGGVLAADINQEFIIRNVQNDSFDVFTAGLSTAMVVGGGGAAELFTQIDEGAIDTRRGQGYGMGLYGNGLYGVSKISFSTLAPRRWSHARFGDLIISTAGGGQGVYSWDGLASAAPTVVTGSPPSANYVFVSDSIAVVLGYDLANGNAVGNGISWSDQGGLTNWTTRQAGSDVIESAGTFISHAYARGENLLFTENQTYTFRYIGGEFIWATRELDGGIGLIAQNARVTARGNVYWMGLENFYMWRGGGVEVIPSNSSEECSSLSYVFDDLNYSQKEKIFAWYNPRFREVWWHYPSANSNEPDRVIRFNVDRAEWVIDEMSRTAAEFPSTLTEAPYLADEQSTIYLHENGFDDDDEPLDWRFVTHYMPTGSNTMQHSAFIPDQITNDEFTVNVKSRDYPLSKDKSSKTYTVRTDDDRISTCQNGRYFQYDVSGNALGQMFIGGSWYQEMKGSTPR